MRLSHIALLSLSTSLATAYELIFYRSQGCRSENLGLKKVIPEDGCRNDFTGVSQSVIVKNMTTDDSYMLTFFRSDDCNPDTEIVHGDPGPEGSSCLSASGYGSFAVWNLYK